LPTSLETQSNLRKLKTLVMLLFELEEQKFSSIER